MSTIAENVIFAPLFTKLISAKISHGVLGLRKKDFDTPGQEGVGILNSSTDL